MNSKFRYRMKQHLKTDYYFDLIEFVHANLFESCLSVWEPLMAIEDYLLDQRLGRIETHIPEGVHLVNPELITILSGTVVEPGAYIKGPCFIGQNCSIRHGAYIRGNVVTGDRCLIGHGTEIKNSILLNEAHAAHFAYVGDSILGNKVNLGAGTVCANLRLDGKPVIVHIENERINTGLRKFGAIIGDNTQIGCNTVSNPGTIIGRNVRCFPCLSIGGIIPSHQIVKSSFSSQKS